MTTMDDYYGDGSEHRMCETCKCCIMCGDCECDAN